MQGTMRHRIALASGQTPLGCYCLHRCRSARALSTGHRVTGAHERTGEAGDADNIAETGNRRHTSSEHNAGPTLARVTEWGVPPRHSIAAYLRDNRDHEFPPRWLGASLPALANVRKSPLQPPPLPTADMLAALTNLQAEHAAAEGAVIDARRTLDDAWRSANALHEQSVNQDEGGLLNAWWNKIKSTSATQWHVADAGDDLIEAKEALAELDGKIWRHLHLTELPPVQYEQIINAGIWQCLTASQTPLDLMADLFKAGPPPSLGSAERLSEFFDIEYLRRSQLLISWDQLTVYTAQCEAEADYLANRLNVDSKQAEYMQAMRRSVLHANDRRRFAIAPQTRAVSMRFCVCKEQNAGNVHFLSACAVNI